MSTFHHIINQKLTKDEYSEFLTLWNQTPSVIKAAKIQVMVKSADEYNDVKNCLLMMLPWEFMNAETSFAWREVICSLNHRPPVLRVLKGGQP